MNAAIGSRLTECDLKGHIDRHHIISADGKSYGVTMLSHCARCGAKLTETNEDILRALLKLKPVTMPSLDAIGIDSTAKIGKVSTARRI